MKKLKVDNLGFSAIEAILVIVIVVLIGTVGWLVYKNHNKTTKAAITTMSSSRPTTATSTKTTMTTPATTFTSGPQRGWETYTNNTVGFSISYPNFIYADNGCASSSTISSGIVPSTFIQDGVNFYIAAKNSYRFTLTQGANQTYNSSDCTEVPTTATTIQADNNSISNNAQYSYSVENLHFVAEKVTSRSDIQTVLQNYWNDNTITISGWKNNSSGNYEVPTAINCSQSEESNQNCGPQGSNYDLRYYPTQKVMFYYVYGQAAHIILTHNTVADSQIINSFTVLNNT